MEEFIKIVLLFFIYSFIGWLWETVYCSIKAGHFVYRGFLVGPITPIYGFGILSVLYFLRPFHQHIVLLFIFATILVTVLEYLTSLILEKLFHASWWDYHDVPLNINGRVALPVSLFWGICCVVIVKIVQPHLLLVEESIARMGGFYLPVVLIALTSMDFGYTLASLTAFQNAVKKLNGSVEKRKAALHADLSEQKAEIQKRLKDLSLDTNHLRESLPQLNFQQRRLLKNYHKLKVKDVKNVGDIRKIVDELRHK